MSNSLEVSADTEQEWLRQAAENGHAPAMHALGLQCEVLERRKRWLRDAAHEGYVPAMYDYGLCCDDPKHKAHWLRMAHAVAGGDVDRGVAICGSGVGASVAANKVAGVRACLIHETFSAGQSIQDDDLNMICLGGLVVGHALAWELVKTFLAAEFSGAERHRRRLSKVAELENKASRNSTSPSTS